MKGTNKVKDFYRTFGDQITSQRFLSPYPVRRYAHWEQYQCFVRQVRPGLKVLDAGCGEGVLAIMLAKVGAEVVACDISEPNILAAKEKALEAGVKVEFLLADSEKLPFEDNHFDLVVSSHVLEHLPNFDLGLREIMRVTKKRAIIAIPTVCNLCSIVQVGGGWFYLKGLKSFLALPAGLGRLLWARLSRQEGVDETYAGQGVTHIFRFPHIMIKKIKKEGFKLVSYEASSFCFPYFPGLLSVSKFLERFRQQKFFRNLGYGTTYVIEK